MQTMFIKRTVLGAMGVAAMLLTGASLAVPTTYVFTGVNDV